MKPRGRAIENETEKPDRPATVDKFDSLAAELVRARKAAGWTQNELHLRTGISRDVIKSYETGRNIPGSKQLRLLSEALDVSPNRLLFGRDEFKSAAGPVKGILNNPTDHPHTKAMKMHLLMNLLTEDEQQAIFTLIEPIIVGRKGGRLDIKKAFATVDVLAKELHSEAIGIAEVIGKQLTEERIKGLEEKMEAKLKERK